MSGVERLSRFEGWSEIQPGCLGGAAEGLRPFFAGPEAYARMDAVRRAINGIRSQWDRYPEFMRELRRTVRVVGADDEDRSAEWEALLASTKSWADGHENPGQQDYTAVSLYTSDAGYRQVYQVINEALRTAGIVEDDPLLRSAAFLVELLNIDLFNLLARKADAADFEGTVYRGMCVTGEELASFRNVARGPIAERYIAIPLSMASASQDVYYAMRFAMERAERDPDVHPLLLEIKVFSLPPETLAAYRAKYPRSVVSSLCAVPVDVISVFPQEKEVLLRGPHFQIVGFHEPEDLPAFERPVYRVEVVMLNSNRDHLTAIASNLGADREARDLFRALVVERRSMLCAEYADRAGQPEDASQYRIVAGQNHQLVTQLLA